MELPLPQLEPRTVGRAPGGRVQVPRGSEEKLTKEERDCIVFAARTEP